MSAIRAFFGSEVDQFLIAFDRVAEYLPRDLALIVLGHGAPKALEINRLVQEILDQVDWNSSRLSKRQIKFLDCVKSQVSELTVTFAGVNQLQAIMNRFHFKPQKLTCIGFAITPKSLKELCIKGAWIKEPKISEIISHNQSLEALEIETAVITDQVIKEFQKLRKLRLTVYDLQFTGKGLSQCRKLTQLFLSRRRGGFGRKVIQDFNPFPIEEVVAGCTALEDLTLEGFCLTAEKIRCLEEAPVLNHVSIADYTGGDDELHKATMSLTEKRHPEYCSYWVFGMD